MAYKNPKMPGPRDTEGAPSVGTMAPVAPGRGNGLMQRAAAARVRQTKPGQPPIPTPAVRPPEPAPPRMAPITDPGQRRDDLERERLRLGQQTERRRQAEEQRKKAEAMQPIDYRQQALQQMAVKGVGVEEEEGKYPTIPKPKDPEMQMHGIQGEEPEESWAMKLAKQQKAKAEAAKQQGDDPDAMDPSKADDEGVKEVEDIKSQQAQKEKEEKEAADKGDPIYDKNGNVIGYQSKGSPGQFVYGADGKTYSVYGLQDKYGAASDSEGKSLEYGAVEGEGEAGVEAGKQWIYDPETGEKVGWKNEAGQFYDMSGKPHEDSGGGITEELFKEKFPGKHTYAQTMDKFSEWLNQKTGIPKEELEGQIAQVYMQSSDQIAKFANMMAARGVGASGLMGAGMGQIASQAVAAVANIKFENEKLKIEEKLNKMKTAAALAGQYMSEENRMKIFEEMSALDKEKFAWTQKQDEEANFWADLNDTTALLQAKNGWDDSALAKAQAAKESGMTSAEVGQHLIVGDDEKVTWQGDDPPGYEYKGAVEGEDPLKAKEGEAWSEQSEAKQKEIIQAFQKNVIESGVTPKSESDIVYYMKEWFGWDIDAGGAEILWSLYSGA